MTTSPGANPPERFRFGSRIRLQRWRATRETHKSVLASELTEVLRTACQESITSETSARTRIVPVPTGKGISYDLALARPFLKEKGFGNHIVMRQPRGKNLSRRPERSKFALNNIVVRRLAIKLDCPLVGGSRVGWELMNWAMMLHFQHCRFIPMNPNSATMEFPWCGRFRLVDNDFAFSGSGGRGWLLVFGNMSEVSFERNRFFESDIDLISGRESSDSHIHRLSWENHNAYLLKDEGFFKAMIRRTHGLPDSARLAIPDSHYSTPHVGLWRVTLIGNSGIRKVQMRCSAKYYAFGGRNKIQSLYFGESKEDMRDSMVYLGPRERIDSDFVSPLHHRDLFLYLKHVADDRGDGTLVGRLERHVNRIEYFLTKEYGVSVQNGIAAWIEHWQDRIRHAWRRWSSDFYGSWMRPLFLGTIGYVGLNGLAWLWIEAFTVTDWVSFSLRRVDRIPFYTAGLRELHALDYDNLTATAKNWLRAIGLLQNVWIGMWGFAFGKAVRR